ncbi:unknown [Sutterella wadsworthensis CAG:135]|nr:unknown [Sutterella wadsworthensis CAG:135]
MAEVQFNNVPLFVCLQRSKRIAFDIAANDKHPGISDCLTNGLIIAVPTFLSALGCRQFFDVAPVCTPKFRRHLSILCFELENLCNSGSQFSHLVFISTGEAVQMYEELLVKRSAVGFQLPRFLNRSGIGTSLCVVKPNIAKRFSVFIESELHDVFNNANALNELQFEIDHFLDILQ